MPSQIVMRKAISVFNYRLLSITRDYEHIRYGLGCKARVKDRELVFSEGPGYGSTVCDGAMVECSSYLRAAFKLALRGFPEDFQRRISNAMASVSEDQIVGIANLGSPMWKGREIDDLDLHAGMLIGVDNGPQGFDAGRKFGIDHILAVARNGGEDGQLCLVQSSSSGVKLGVNAVDYAEWRNDYAKAYNENRVFCVDIFETDGFDLPVVRRPETPGRLSTTSITEDVIIPDVDPVDFPEIDALSETAGPS